MPVYATFLINVPGTVDPGSITETLTQGPANAPTATFGPLTPVLSAGLPDSGGNPTTDVSYDLTQSLPSTFVVGQDAVMTTSSYTTGGGTVTHPPVSVTGPVSQGIVASAPSTGLILTRTVTSGGTRQLAVHQGETAYALPLPVPDDLGLLISAATSVFSPARRDGPDAPLSGRTLDISHASDGSGDPGTGSLRFSFPDGWGEADLPAGEWLVNADLTLASGTGNLPEDVLLFVLPAL